MDLRSQLQDHLGTTFRLDRELGGGGMSRVFVAHEHRLSRNVVIKVLSPELVAGINAERFEREILLAASLQQANIVPVLAAGEVAGLPYFTMPFVEGESLRTRLTGAGLPIADVLAILRDVTKALAYAHARNIVHRDIKPDNVLLSGGTAVVTDFGIAKALSASRTGGVGATLTSVGTSIGTPAYMAPEQVAGDPNIDHRVDLYSLGCMAYELLTGRSPFADRTPQKMLAAHLSEAPRAIESYRGDCPPALAKLVSDLLAKDPNDRVQQASDVLRTLDQASTTSSPTLSMSAPGMLPKALAVYALATGAVAIVAKAAVVGIGLPAWTFPGAVVVMLLGLPMLLFTAWVKRTARHAASATPTLTPGGSLAPVHGTMATIALKANRHVSWRRTVRGGLLAMGAFVLLVMGFMVTRAMGIGPAASLFAAGTLSADDRVLLADFVAAPEDSSLAPIVVEAVRAAMSQSRAVKMLEPADVVRALQQMQRDPRTPLTPDVATEVAARAGARAILGGRLARAGSGYLVSLELTSADGGAPLASFQGTADGVTDLLSVVDDLSRKLRGKVGESLRQVQRSVPLEQATTASLEALRLFTEGTRANDFEEDYEGAVRVLREAVAIDSTFALAWRKLSAALFNARLPLAAHDSALERAVQYVDKLPQRERHLIMGAYYDRHSTRADRGRAVAEYRALYALDSTERIATNQLAILYSDRSEMDSALRYARRQLVIEPVLTNQVRVMRALVLAGETAEAQAILDSIRRADPGAATQGSVATNAILLAYAKGNWSTARTAAEATMRSAQGAFRVAGMNQAAALDRIGGRLASAEALDRERIALQATRGTLLVGGLGEAHADINLRGQPVAGIARLDRIVAGAQWAAAPVDRRPYSTVADLYAEAGAPDKARRMLALARAEDREGYDALVNRTTLAYTEGLILLAEGKPDAALPLFRASGIEPDGARSECQACVAWVTARAHDLAVRPDSAVAWLERYLAVPQGQRFFADNLYIAAVRKRLGELYDQRGERAKAIEQYEAFVTQWQDADADLQPAVASVRTRLNELRGQEGT